MTRTRHRTTWIALLVWMALGGAFARAGSTTPASPRTGDAWVDRTLPDIDLYAARYPDAFVDELARYHGAPRELVLELLAGGRWTAGDVYFACVLGQYAGQPCRSIVAVRDRNRARDWSALAGDLGVTPGSDAFQRIKGAIVRSYARWARPLQGDATPTPAASGQGTNRRKAPAAPHPREASA